MPRTRFRVNPPGCFPFRELPGEPRQTLGAGAVLQGPGRSPHPFQHGGRRRRRERRTLERGPDGRVARRRRPREVRPRLAAFQLEREVERPIDRRAPVQHFLGGVSRPDPAPLDPLVGQLVVGEMPARALETPHDVEPVRARLRRCSQRGPERRHLRAGRLQPGIRGIHFARRPLDPSQHLHRQGGAQHRIDVDECTIHAGEALDRRPDAPTHVVGTPGRQLLVDLHVDLDVNAMAHVVRPHVMHASHPRDPERLQADPIDQLLAGTLSHQVVDVLPAEPIAAPHDPDSDEDACQRVEDLGTCHGRRETDQRGQRRPDVVLALDGVGEDGGALELFPAAA